MFIQSLAKRSQNALSEAFVTVAATCRHSTARWRNSSSSFTLASQKRKFSGHALTFMLDVKDHGLELITGSPPHFLHRIGYLLLSIFRLPDVRKLTAIHCSSSDLISSRNQPQFLAHDGVGGLQGVPHADASEFYQFIVAPHDVLPTCELRFEQIDIELSQNEKTLRPHVMVCFSISERRSGN
jgi:hypothetical protein